MKVSAACAIAAVGALALVGCGSEDDTGDASGSDTVASDTATSDDSVTSDTAASDTVVSDDSVTSESAPSDSAPSDSAVEQSDDDTAEDDGGGEAGGSSEEFCTALEEADSQAGVGTDVDATVAVFEGIDEAAPAEISEATGALLDFFARGAEIAELPEEERADAALEFAELEQDFTEATEQIETYARENCDNLGDDFFGGS